MGPRDLLNHLTAASQVRVGAIVFGTPGKKDHEIGTGTLLRRGSQRFIATCKHVVDAFFAAKEAWINLYGSQALERGDVKRVYDDAQLDIAVLAVSARVRTPEHLKPALVADLANRSEYLRARVDWSGRYYAICGFPSELASYARADLIAMRPMCYGTLPCRTHEPNGITLEYVEMEDGTKPPAARGLSGSLIWQLAPAQDGKIWVPGKAIAMQHAWTPRKRLICSPLYRLRKWFLSAS